MKRVKPQKNPSGNAWSLIGQLKLPVDSISGESIDGWLIKTLESFQIPPDLFNKIKTSIAEAISRLNATPETSYLSLSIYILQDMKAIHPENRSWGFFKLEKAGTFTAKDGSNDHVIEYYLYLDV